MNITKLHGENYLYKHRGHEFHVWQYGLSEKHDTILREGQIKYKWRGRVGTDIIIDGDTRKEVADQCKETIEAMEFPNEYFEVSR